MAGVGGGDAEHQAGSRDDAVVGAEHGGAQPATLSMRWISLSFVVVPAAISRYFPRAGDRRIVLRPVVFFAHAFSR